MLIFLAGLALLLILFTLGEVAAPHVWHGGSRRILDRCPTCDRNYPRPAGLQRMFCPHGHAMTALVAEPHTPAPGSFAFIAVCAGFILITLVLTVAGVVPLP